MGDAKLNPRQLVDVLSRLEEIDRHRQAIRQQLIEVMSQRRRTSSPAKKRAAPGKRRA